MKIAVTGHRPKGLFRSDPYSVANQQKLLLFCRQLVKQVKQQHTGVEFIQGMALGFDQAIGEACVLEGVPFHAYVPFEGQANAWPPSARITYRALLSKAAIVKVISQGNYSPLVLNLRNEAMVDDCELLIALWSGDDGGTANAVRYAQTKNIKVINVWEYWEKVR